MPAIKQHGCSTIRCRDLKAPGSGHVRFLHLGDHAGERPVAQAIFGHRQHLGILASLRVQDAIGAEPNLLKAWRVEVELGERPEHCPASVADEPGSYARREERGGCVVVEASGCCRDFVQPGACQATIRETIVHRRNAERQGRRARLVGARNLGAKQRQGVGREPIGQG